jgi:enterochelin esterase-like enzyme
MQKNTELIKTKERQVKASYILRLRKVPAKDLLPHIKQAFITRITVSQRKLIGTSLNDTKSFMILIRVNDLKHASTNILKTIKLTPKATQRKKYTWRSKTLSPSSNIRRTATLCIAMHRSDTMSTRQTKHRKMP